MIDQEVVYEIGRLKIEQDRPMEDNVSILEMEEGQEQDILVNGVLRTYIKRNGKVFYLAWTEV